MLSSATLPSLLRAALKGLECAYIEEGAGAGGLPPLELWANLLRALNDRGADLRELQTILCLSKRALRSRVSVARRKGWIEQFSSGRGRASVRLTAQGSNVAVRWRALQDAAERRWRAKIGVGPSRRLRAALEGLVAKMPVIYAHYPASYGAADARITGGNGQDWKSVPREGGESLVQLPDLALLSQVLAAFAVSYEEKSPVALSLSASVIRRIPPEGRPRQGLGPPAGVAALHRHGFVRVRGRRGSEILWLTTKGVAVSAAYEERVRGIEREWCRVFGDQQCGALRRALEDAAGAHAAAKRTAR